MTTKTLKNESGWTVEIDEFSTTYRRDDHCDKHGAFENVSCRPKSDPEPRWIGCDECRNERDAERQRFNIEEQERKRLADRLARAGIPPRFEQAMLATYVATNTGQKHALESANRYAAEFPTVWERGESLLLLGSVGNGKTHLAVGIAREAMKQGFNAIFITAAEMIGKAKETWGCRDGDSYETVIRRFASVDLLVLDEVGSIKCSGREREIMLAILGGRHNAMLPTIFTANLLKDELPLYLGDQIVSRLRESGSDVVVFNWQDYRPTKAKALAGSHTMTRNAA